MGWRLPDASLQRWQSNCARRAALSQVSSSPKVAAHERRAVAGWVTAAGGVVVLGVITSLVIQEATGWLDTVPGWLLRLARRRLPPSSRDTLYDEWAAELHAALHGMDSRPLSRLVLGIRYAAGLLRTARRVAREIGPARNFNHHAEATAEDLLIVPSLDMPQADLGER